MGYQSIFTKGLFAGRTVMITGGASGIGRCTAHELAALDSNSPNQSPHAESKGLS